MATYQPRPLTPEQRQERTARLTAMQAMSPDELREAFAADHARHAARFAALTAEQRSAIPFAN